MRGRFILRVLLAVGCLVPTGVLFVQFWQSTSDKVAFVARERDGVTYLGALAQLSTALAQADAAASGGDAAPAGALGRAVDTVSAVDLRLGDELRTHERWTDLRGKIGSLPHSGTDPAAADTAYHGVGELLLALYTKVQTAANLVRDPGADSFFLQSVAAAQLPAAVVASGHLVDVAASAAARPADALLDVAEARAETLAATAQTLDGLTLAEEASISPTLGGTLLGVVDKFQLAVQSLTTLTATDMLPTTVHRNLAQLRQVQAGLVTAAASLNGGILRELDRLLAQRTSGLTPERRLALAAAATAVLFAGLSLLLGSGSRRRVRPPSAPAAPGVPPPDRVPPADRVPTADRVPSWPGPGFRVPDEREWSGAAR